MAPTSACWRTRVSPSSSAENKIRLREGVRKYPRTSATRMRTPTSLARYRVPNGNFVLVAVAFLARYRVPNGNFVLVAVAFLGGFQTDRLDEIVQRLKHGSVSTVQGCDLFLGDGLVCGKGLQDAGSEWSIKPFIELQENYADLIAVREEPVAAGVRDLFDQTFGAQLPEVITERSKLVLFRYHPECLQGLRV